MTYIKPREFPTRRMPAIELRLLQLACERLPAPAKAPSIDEMNRQAYGISPSGLMASQTTGTVRP